MGLNERDAPLELLERLNVPERALPKALALLRDSPHASEAVLLSTCLRTEVYAVVDRFHDGVADIEAFFASRLGGSSGWTSELSERLVVAFDDSAAEHLFAVAAGIDSPVLGEGEILRQVRRAEEVARAEHACGPVLGGMFRHAVVAGKRARAETAIARGVTSLAHVAVNLAARRCGGLAGRQVVVVGAGEMGAGIVAALGSGSEPPSVAVVNRSPARARELAAVAGGRPLPLSALPGELARADVLIAAAGANDTLIGSEQLAPALASRPDRPLFVVDVAVPRNVDPAVAELPGVELFDLDDLRREADGEMAARRVEVAQVRAILAEELERYRTSVAGRNVAPLVSALRARAESVRAGELARSAALLEALDPEQAEAVRALTRRIVAKLLHEPTVQVKQAAGTARGERLAESLRQLFEL